MAQHFGPSILETWLSCEFLEPLTGFLAYLDPKLCHKNQKVVKISTPEKGNQGGTTPHFYKECWKVASYMFTRMQMWLHRTLQTVLIQQLANV